MAIQSSNPPEIHSFGPWLGLNQQSPQGSIGDDEEFWNENFFAIGPGNLRSCWGIVRDATTDQYLPIYTAPAGVKILRIFFGTYGNTTPQFTAPPPGQLGWMFLSDGTIDEVELSTGGVTHVGGAGVKVWEPISPQFWASAKVWRPQFFGNVAGQQGGVLFGSPAGLFAWDGVTLSGPGAPAPDWLTNAQETGSPPVPFTMPQGLPGIYAMEVYESRLWVAGKDVISFSAPSNGADFSTTDGGGSFGYFGDKLVYSYMDLAASAGYLFLFGDSSIDMIGNVTLAGSGTPESPFTTNFTIQNIDPQVGQRFPRPVGRIGRFFELWNGAGIFECQGGNATQIGQKVTNILNTLVYPKTAADANGTPPLYYPTMATTTMFGFKVLLCNGRFTDPFGVTRNLLLMWHPEQTNFWSVATQNIEFTNIGHYEQDSIIAPFGTDGTHLYELFVQPDHGLVKRLVTKGLRGDKLAQITIKNWKRLFLEYQDNTGTNLSIPTGSNPKNLPQGVNITGVFATYGGGIPNGRQDIGFTMAGGETFLIQPYTIQGQGITGAVDISSISPDFTIERLHVVTEERTLWGA